VVHHDPKAAIRAWGHWDAVWYLHIANHGYTDNHLAAFPLSALVFTSSSVLLSSGRFTIAVFPLFIVAAVIASRRAWLERLWSAVFITLGVYYLAAFATSRWAG
jgi:hypothetical protein